MSTLETLLIGKTALLVINYWTKRMDVKDMLFLKSRGSTFHERPVRFKVAQPSTEKREMVINIKGAKS